MLHAPGYVDPTMLQPRDLSDLYVCERYGQHAMPSHAIRYFSPPLNASSPRAALASSSSARVLNVSSAAYLALAQTIRAIKLNMSKPLRGDGTVAAMPIALSHS